MSYLANVEDVCREWHIGIQEGGRFDGRDLEGQEFRD